MHIGNLDKFYIQNQKQLNNQMNLKNSERRANESMVRTNNARFKLSRETLIKIRIVAIRKGVWFKTLSKAERALVELTIRIVRKIWSPLLNRVLTSITEKLQASLEGRVTALMRKVGHFLAEKIGMIAQSWGYVSASKWKSEHGFIRFLAVMYLNSPRMFGNKGTRP